MNPRIVPVLLLDLDGTVRHGLDELGRFVNGPADVVLFPEAPELIRRWRAGGGRVVAVTNQGGIALGYAQATDIWGAYQKTKTLLQTDGNVGATFDAVHLCPHHPDAADLTMRHCWCRKPHPGAITAAITALHNAYPPHIEVYPRELAVMVGDRNEDREAAQAAGVTFKWAQEWRALHGSLLKWAGWPPRSGVSANGPDEHPDPGIQAGGNR